MSETTGDEYVYKAGFLKEELTRPDESKVEAFPIYLKPGKGAKERVGNHLVAGGLKFKMGIIPVREVGVVNSKGEPVTGTSVRRDYFGLTPHASARRAAADLRASTFGEGLELNKKFPILPPK